MLSPLKIKLNEQKSLTIKWNNGKEHTIPLQFMRDKSPDASNKGETILWKHYAPPPQGPDKPGKYEVDNIEVVGSYAIQIRWKDGFDHGIYSWNLLEKWGDFWEVKDNLPENFDDEHK